MAMTLEKAQNLARRLAAATRTNQLPGTCRLCQAPVPAGEGWVWWCEDGTPIHCDRHFDSGGWEVSCGTIAACAARMVATAEERQADRESSERQRAEEIQRQEDTAAGWEGLVATATEELPATTGYGPHLAWRGSEVLVDGAEGVAEEVASFIDERFGRSERQALVRLTDGRVAVVGTVTRWYLPSEAAADAQRLAAALVLGVTPERARVGLESPYIGDDQRRMYELVATVGA